MRTDVSFLWFENPPRERGLIFGLWDGIISGAHLCATQREPVVDR